MRAMKDSGIEWIGRIPETWSIERIKFHAKLNPQTLIPFIEDDDIVSFIPMECLKQGYHSAEDSTFSKVKKGYVSFQKGDVLIAKVTPCFENGNLAIADNLICNVGFGSTEINVIRCFSIHSQYLFYMLQCKPYIEKATYDMYGVAGLKRLNPDFIPNSFVPIPSMSEQVKIANYINQRSAELDALIDAKEKTNALLKERRQSLIYEAVTKGLDSTVPMKDSGVSWLGQIPREWSVVSLKRLGTPETGATPSKTNTDYWDGEIPWVSSKDMKADYLPDSEDHITQEAVDETGLKLFPRNTVIFCVRSGILRHTFPVSIATVPVTINQDLRAMVLTDEIDSSFLLYYLRGINDSIIALYQKIGATVESIEMDWLMYLPVLLPPKDEQRQIVAYLKNSCASIDETIKTNETTITKLKEYRQSLIYEAVTGKIEVEHV